jgi:hypothetical protein
MDGRSLRKTEDEEHSESVGHSVRSLVMGERIGNTMPQLHGWNIISFLLKTHSVSEDSSAFIIR